MLDNLSREDLFLLVWAKPVKDIAGDYGVEPATVTTLCKRLQVPRPPRGYWSQIRAGKSPTRPFLPVLAEHLAEGRRERSSASPGGGWVDLAPVQAKLFKRALKVAEDAGYDTSHVQVSKSGARFIDGALAAQLMLIAQNSHLQWLRERSPDQEVSLASLRSAASLVSKLMRLSKPQVLLLAAADGDWETKRNEITAVVHLTADLRQQLANLRNLTAQQRLSHVAIDLGPFEHSWLVQYIQDYDEMTKIKSQLYVSQTQVWLKCKLQRYSWTAPQEVTLETKKLPINTIVPAELLNECAVEIPSALDFRKLKLSSERLQAYQDAEHAFDLGYQSLYQHQFSASPDARLVLLEKIALGPGRVAEGPLTKARQTIENVENDLESLEQVLDQERHDICRDALGVQVGTTVLSEIAGKPVRLEIEHMSFHIAESGELRFMLSGPRYRQDGILGKRYETIHVTAVRSGAKHNE